MWFFDHMWFMPQFHVHIYDTVQSNSESKIEEASDGEIEKE